MFRPSPMDRVELLLLKSDLPAVSRGLARERILHLRPVERKGLQRPTPEGGEPSTEKLLAFSAALEETMTALGLEGEGGDPFLPIVEFPLWEEWAAELEERVRGIVHREAELSRRLEELAHLEAFLTPLVGLEGDFSALTALRHARLRIGTLPLAAAGKLEEETFPAEVFPLRRSRREVAVAVISTRGEEGAAGKILADLDFRPVPLCRTLSDSFEAMLEKIRRVRLRIVAYRASLDARLAGLREEHRRHLRDRYQAVSSELFLRQVEDGFGFTRRSVLLAGWVPRRRYRKLGALLGTLCPGRFALRRMAAKGDETPVELTNPFFFRPFQKILHIFGTPLYGEVEPTPLLAVGFLLLFGMMFGDVGQGFVLALAGMGMRRFTRFAEEGLFLAEVGGSALLFGLLFGSVFGVESLLPPLWFSPFDHLLLLMSAALAVGVFLIFFGLLLRIANLWGRTSPAELWTDRYGIAGALFYGGAVATVLPVILHRAPAALLLWLLLPLGAIFFHPLVSAGEEERNLPLLLAEGVIEVMETVLGYLVNTFSFLRVGAFGLAHIGLFYAVFALADLVARLPLGPLWVALIYLFGNLLILALEGLVVSIQAIRLQFYEFFSKFFQGGGIPYRPLVLEPVGERRR